MCGGSKHHTHQEKPWAVRRVPEASGGRKAAGVLPALPLSHGVLKALQLLHKLRRFTPKKAEDQLERGVFLSPEMKIRMEHWLIATGNGHVPRQFFFNLALNYYFKPFYNFIRDLFVRYTRRSL